MNELLDYITEQLDAEAFGHHDPREFAEACIREHQQQHPANWQNWTVEERGPAMLAMLRRAVTEREVIPARVVLYCA